MRIINLVNIVFAKFEFVERRQATVGLKTNPKVGPNWRAKRGTLWHFSTFLSQNIKKIEGGPFGGKNSKKTHSVKKNWKGGPLGIFKHPFYRKTFKKLKGDPLVKHFFGKKVPQCRDPLDRYATRKKGKPFRFNSLGQMVQFDTIKFRRTFKNYFGQFVWIENSH